MSDITKELPFATIVEISEEKLVPYVWIIVLSAWPPYSIFTATDIIAIKGLPRSQYLLADVHYMIGTGRPLLGEKDHWGRGGLRGRGRLGKPRSHRALGLPGRGNPVGYGARGSWERRLGRGSERGKCLSVLRGVIDQNGRWNGLVHWEFKCGISRGFHHFCANHSGHHFSETRFFLPWFIVAHI